MKAVRARVEARHAHENLSRDEREREFKIMMLRFRKAVTEAGILQDCKAHEEFESKSRKARRKKKEAAITRLKSRLKENFSGRRNYD